MIDKEPIVTPVPLQQRFRILFSILLWLVSAFLALAAIFALRDLLLWLLANLLIKPDAKSNYDVNRFIDVANDCGALIFGVLCLGVIVVSSEYVFHHLGQARLNRILTILIVVECVIVLPVAWFFWRT
jgi:hypothetical protein